MVTGVEFEDPPEVFAEAKPASLIISTTATISSLAKECLKRYDGLYDTLRQMTPDAEVSNGFVGDNVLIRVQDARPRFKAWATNIAALHEGHMKSSLEFRLREATEIRSRVLKILGSLKESLVEAEFIVAGVRGNTTWKVGAMSDSSFTSEEGSEYSSDESDSGSMNEKLETSELDELLSAMETANRSLMKISIVIRNTPTRDDYVKAAARFSLDSHWDISHVDAKFGAARRSGDWLIQRLGRSITRRRQYLTYREEHHEKLAKDWETPVKPVIVLKEDEDEDEQAPQTLALTKATTYVEALPTALNDGSEVGSFETETSYQQTMAGEIEEHLLTVPPPPSEAFEGVPFEFGHPFQCPYCWTEQTVKGRNAWKKHVFRDLRPYVCTFKECNLRMFRSRNEWFAHELQAHRREWTCATCSKLCSSKSNFKSHILSHNSNLAGSELDAVILQSEEPMDRFPASACSFCNEWEVQITDSRQIEKRTFLNDGKDVTPYGTKTQLRRHLGRHMEQLALFALPRENVDNVEDESVKDIRGEVDNDDCDASTGTTVSEYLPKEANAIDTLQNETLEIQDELSGFTSRVSMSGEASDIVCFRSSLVGPWGKDSHLVPITFNVFFRGGNLDLSAAKFEVSSENDNEPLSMEVKSTLQREVQNQVDVTTGTRKSCLRGILKYLSGRPKSGFNIKVPELVDRILDHGGAGLEHTEPILVSQVKRLKLNKEDLSKNLIRAADSSDDDTSVRNVAVSLDEQLRLNAALREAADDTARVETWDQWWLKDAAQPESQTNIVAEQYLIAARRGQWSQIPKAQHNIVRQHLAENNDRTEDAQIGSSHTRDPEDQHIAQLQGENEGTSPEAMESVTVIGSQVATSGSREIATNPEELKYLIDGHTAQEWEAIKDPVLKLYLGTGRTPFEVRTILEETHQFRTT
ncbi:uncharacterized protein RAG0_16547 [Rhynchosporium agropyri]|uniref:C2H2-type domain-containing protein n=1 Tax=Rhynchosporium agropyri TaxID=914238 RepID=A0A1E1LQW7_9HELO|nr:uncharacterized protein RAG0_16547 [Rhynchosporium agropyri]